MSNELTDRKVASIKGSGKREELKDGRWPLWLIVQPTGTKSFQWRGTVSGRDRRRTLGRYYDPHTGTGLRLAEARKLSLAARLDATSNRAVAQVPEPPQSPSTKECFKHYMERDGGRRVSAPAKWLMWHRDLEPVIGDTPIAAVTREALAHIIAERFDAIVDAGGTGVGANRLHSHMSRFFSWSMKNGWLKTRLDHNPMAMIEKPTGENVRTRVLSPNELKWFWQALRMMASGRWNDASPIYARGFELLLRTLTRRSEVFTMEWGWIDGSKLLIPTTKNADSHLLWLHPSAQSLIGARPANAGNSQRVFEVCPTAMSKPMRRLRKAMSALAALEGEEIEHWSLHDLRRTATTTIAGILDPDDRPLVQPIVRDRLLNHREKGVMRHYDHHAYYAEKKAALKLWNDELDRIFNNAADDMPRLTMVHEMDED